MSGRGRRRERRGAARRAQRSSEGKASDRAGLPLPAPARDWRRTLTLLAVVLGVAAALIGGAFVPAPHSGGDNAGYVTLAYSLLEHGSYAEALAQVRARVSARRSR